MSQALTLARPYARAAFAAARDEGRAAVWSQALGFAARVAADPQASALLGNPELANADAVALLAPEGADETFVRFLDVLADNHRLALLPEIAGLYEELRAEAERILKAKIVSAAEMPGEELQAIVAGLRRRFGREVEVETAVDASLIGGALIDTGELVIDGSLRGKLERLQTALSQ